MTFSLNVNFASHTFRKVLGENSLGKIEGNILIKGQCMFGGKNNTTSKVLRQICHKMNFTSDEMHI